MTLHHFNTLNQNKQKETMLERGAFLADRTTEDFITILYQVDGFYVEIIYLRADNKIVLVRSFDSADELQPYLEQIDLSNLL